MNDAKNRPGEFDLIEELFVPLAKSQLGAVGLQDDCAALAVTRGCEALYTVDTLVAGVHFFENDPANLIARKLLRVSLSDIAASGGVPKGYMLALSLPDDISYEWLRSFVDGLSKDQEEYEIGLLGGDTTSTSGPLTLSLTAIGEVPKGSAVRRSGAKLGDEIFVTGTIGDAALALNLISEKGHSYARENCSDLYDRFLLPQPRTQIGPLLIGTATACVDISDGLHADLKHICDASNVGADIIQTDIPISPDARALLKNDSRNWQYVFGGGDDYELLFTASPINREKVFEFGKTTGVSISRIGSVVSEQTISVVDAEGRSVPVEMSGWQHF